jgi:hypothetical protein
MRAKTLERARIAAIVAALVLVACKKAETSANDAGAPLPPPTPIEGTIATKPFTASSGVALRDPRDASRRVVRVAATPLSCRDKPTLVGEPTLPHIVAHVPWRTGQHGVDKSMDASFFAIGEIGPSLFPAGSGAVTVVTAPSEPSSTARLHLDLHGVNDRAVGDVDVVVCP